MSAIGGIITAVQQDMTVNRLSAMHACCCGVLWAFGIACIAIALGKFDGQISQHAGRLLLATVFTIAGGCVFMVMAGRC